MCVSIDSFLSLGQRLTSRSVNPLYFLGAPRCPRALLCLGINTDASGQKAGDAQGKPEAGHNQIPSV